VIAMRLLARHLLAGIVAVLGGSLAAAQSPAPASRPAASDEKVLRVFEIRYRDVSEVSMLIQPALGPTVLTVNRETRTITVVDRPDVVERVADFLRQFDVPPQAVVVRIVLEKAQRKDPPAGREIGGDSAFRNVGAWSYVPLADATMEVLERGQATQVIGPDGAFEVHVHLESVDPGRRTMRFDELRLSRRDAPAAGADGSTKPRMLPVLTTSMELHDRVDKVVMTARDPAADEALVVRIRGLIRQGAQETR
jgi:hypothetical protein